MAIFLDTNIVIYHVEDIAPWSDMVDAAIAGHPGGAFAVTDLVRLECRVGPLRRGQYDLLGRFDAFFASVAVLPMTPAVFDRAAELRAKHRLKTPDALHLATAIEHGCAELWTNDARLSGIASTVAVRNVTAR